MGRLFNGAKAKAWAEKRNKQIARLKERASDNAYSSNQPDPWSRTKSYTKFANAKSKLGKSLCEHCGWFPPKVSMLHAHHIIPRACGGLDTPSNLIVLCPNCHAIAHYVTATSRLQRKYTGPATAAELREWMDVAYDTPALRTKQRAHLLAGVHPLIDSLHWVPTLHNPA